MKLYQFLLTVPIIMGSFFLSNAASQPIEDDDKTLSPYFQIIGGDASTEKLPLLSTSADVRIAGVIADVTVTQVYKNSGLKPIEAIYVFPASTRAAVYGMTMTIADRIIKAKIEKREAARKTYEKAKKEGYSASLLEQQRPNVFQMNVANIMPGDTIIVELRYTELLVPESGIYEFTYPAVVGPRYSNKKEADVASSGKFVASPYQHEGEMPLYKFGLNVTLDAGMPLSEIACKTHQVEVYMENESLARIGLKDTESNGGNRDFVLSYRLQGDKIKTGLILSKGAKENFFLLMLQPPKQVKPEDLPPRDYIFILDVSGSMHGFPLSISKTLIEEMLDNLQGQDKFNILFFAGSASFLFDRSMEANGKNLQKAISFISSIDGSGGTELLPALKQALGVPKDPGYSRTIAILTDGYVDVEEETFDLIKDNLGEANFYAFGIGSSVNRYLIEGIARCGMGQPFVVLKPDEAEQTAEKFAKYISSPVMTDIKLKFDGFETYDVEPKTIPDVTSERPILVFGKWRDNASGTINVSGTAGRQELMVSIPLSRFAEFDTSSALKYLWARHRIMSLSDYESTHRSNKESQVTDLGIKYNLLTKYTSFVAVDYNRKNNTTGTRSVSQPLPMPEGVTDGAVGGSYFAQSYGSSSGGYEGWGNTNPLIPMRARSANYIGPVFGYNRSHHTEISDPSQSLIPGFSNYDAASNGYFFGLNFNIPFSAVNSKHLLTMDILYDSRPGSYSVMPALNLRSITGDSVPAGATSTVEINYLTIDAIYSMAVIGNLRLATGVSASFRIKSDIKTEFQLPADKTFRVEDNPVLALNGKTQDISDFNGLLLAMKFQVLYEIIMSGRYFIAPFVGYDFGLTNLSRSSYWKLNKFEAGVKITFAI